MIRLVTAVPILLLYIHRDGEDNVDRLLCNGGGSSGGSGTVAAAIIMDVVIAVIVAGDAEVAGCEAVSVYHPSVFG